MAGSMNWLTNPCYEALISQNLIIGELTPQLAERWDQDPEGKYITLYLRKGVKYHDGTDFNAKAVKDYLELKMKDMPGFLSEVESIDILDEHTVKLNTKHISLITLVSLQEPISSPTHLAKDRDSILYHPVGTGPFKFAEFKRDVSLKYVRFDDYWGEKPYLDGFELIFVPDATTQIASFLAGEAHGLSRLGVKDAETLKAAGFKVVSIGKPSSYCGFAPDTANPDSPLANKKVLAAIEYAINREEIAETLGYGYWEPHDYIIPNDIEGYDPDSARKYDPDKARELLAEAGYPNGFETTIITSPNAYMDMIVAVQGNLAEVGIKARIDAADMGRHSSLRNTGWKDSLLYVHGVYGNPFEYYFYRTWAAERKDYVSAARPDGFDELLNKIIFEMDTEARSKMMVQLAKMMSEESMYLPLIAITSLGGLSPDVHDYGQFTKSASDFNFQEYNTWLSK